MVKSGDLFGRPRRILRLERFLANYVTSSGYEFRSSSATVSRRIIRLDDRTIFECASFKMLKGLRHEDFAVLRQY